MSDPIRNVQYLGYDIIIIIIIIMYIYIYIYVPMYVFAVVKWADGFSSVPRISPVLGRTVSGSTF